MYTSDTERTDKTGTYSLAVSADVHDAGSKTYAVDIPDAGSKTYAIDIPDAGSNLKKGMRYLTASLIIAAAAAIYGLFSHGVYSYYMTYAFMIPLICGALPHLIMAMREPGANKETVKTVAASGAEEYASGAAVHGKTDRGNKDNTDRGNKDNTDRGNKKRSAAGIIERICAEGDLQLAVIATLTAGSLLKGALDIYGTTNRLLIAYPVIALVTIIAGVLLKRKNHLEEKYI